MSESAEQAKPSLPPHAAGGHWTVPWPAFDPETMLPETPADQDDPAEDSTAQDSTQDPAQDSTQDPAESSAQDEDRSEAEPPPPAQEPAPEDTAAERPADDEQGEAEQPPAGYGLPGVSRQFYADLQEPPESPEPDPQPTAEQPAPPAVQDEDEGEVAQDDPEVRPEGMWSAPTTPHQPLPPLGPAEVAPQTLEVAPVAVQAVPQMPPPAPQVPQAGQAVPQPQAPQVPEVVPQVPPFMPQPQPPQEMRSAPRGKRWRIPLLVAAALVVVLVALVGVQLVRPLPEPVLRQRVAAVHTFTGPAPALPWPNGGQAELSVDGIGTMGSRGGRAPTPTASVAKVMTAYVFLKNHPLRPGENGPTFNVTAEEAAKVPLRRQRGESRVEVKLGQRFTQRKALEALMVVSANDIAHELARWDARSVPAFVTKMNAAARQLGMTNTRYTDPSGYDSGTVSTAADQVKLLRAAMRIPAFAEVVSKQTYEPVDGTPVRQAGNLLLGRNGVVGGKTGYTNAAGGNFVFAARKPVAGVDTLVVGAVMGQPGGSAQAAIFAAERLLVAAQNAITGATVVRPGQPVAEIDDGLGSRTPLTAATPITVIGWPGLTVRLRVTGTPPHQADQGASVASLAIGDGKIRFPLRLPRPLHEPDLVTRLTRGA